METVDETVERREMAALKEGIRTLAADDIDWCVSQFDCLCEWHVTNFYPMILNCRHRVVVRQIGYKVVPYSLTWVEIFSSTCSIKQRSS
jgi:hypothetical protein